MSRMIELTDLITDQTATVSVDDVDRTLRYWYENPTQDVLDAIDEFQRALLASAYEARELAEFLGIGFWEVQQGA